MRAIFPALALFALAACQPAAQENPGQPASAVTPEPILSAAALQGEYRLAGIDGQDPDLPEGVAVSITADAIGVPGACVLTGWRYRFEGGRLGTEEIAGPARRRAGLPHEQAIRAAIDRPDRVTRTPANGILRERGGRIITLFPQ